MADVKEFFEKQGEGSYAELKTLTRRQDEAAAALLNAEVTGEALSIGGVWEGYKPGPLLSRLQVLDVSQEMLRKYAPQGAEPVVGDLYEKDFPERSLDAVVFSLVLHHVAQGSWKECRSRVETALARAKKWLKPGGKLFILEYCPARPWMPVQRLALPFTKAFLAVAGQPLVVMHERGFYERALQRAGFSPVTARAIRPDGVSDWEWFPVFMGVKWLKLPLKVYPKMHVFTGVKAR